MDIPPTDVHQRVPCILGSRDDILEMRRYYVESDDPELIARCKDRLRGAGALDEEDDCNSSTPRANLGMHNRDGGVDDKDEALIGEFGAAK